MSKLLKMMKEILTKKPTDYSKLDEDSVTSNDVQPNEKTTEKSGYLHQVQKPNEPKTKSGYSHLQSAEPTRKREYAEYPKDTVKKIAPDGLKDTRSSSSSGHSLKSCSNSVGVLGNSPGRGGTLGSSPQLDHQQMRLILRVQSMEECGML